MTVTKVNKKQLINMIMILKILVLCVVLSIKLLNMKKLFFYILLIAFSESISGSFRMTKDNFLSGKNASLQYSGNGAGRDKRQTVDSTFHIYLCFGQSNMEGNADIEDVDMKGVDKRFQVMSVCDEDLKMGRTPGNWYTAVPPLCRYGAKLSVADYFGRTMVDNLPESYKVGVVMVAIGGAGIDCFDKDNYAKYYENADEWQKYLMGLYGGNPYAKLVEFGKRAKKRGIIKGILLHQGESNNGQADWPEKVGKIYRDLLRDLDLKEEEVPLFAGEMLSEAEGGICAGHNEYVAVLPWLVNAHVVSSEGCKGASDGLHFTSEGYREMGRHYARVVLNKIYGIPLGMPDMAVINMDMPNKDLEVQIGKGQKLELMATFEDGHTEDVAYMAKYEIENTEVADIKDGEVRGLSQGCTEVKAIYTDPVGKVSSLSFTLNSTCFPFSEEFIETALFGNGTYREAARAFFPGENGQMGWKYTYGLDMSGYKYLVLKLDKVQKVGACIMLYTENNIWSDCCQYPVGEEVLVAVPLHDITYTSGELQGEPVDVSHVMIVALYAGQGGVIDVADMYLTNNEDYSSDAVSVFSVKSKTSKADGIVYDLSGVRMNGTDNLPKGIYIKDGKKFVVK